jgi:hypothetical protein
MLTDILGYMIGLIAVFGTLLLILIVVLMDNKSRRIRTKLLHDERMLALEKGLPVPMELGDFGKKRRPYVRGLVFLAIGVGLIIMGATTNDEGVIGFGVIPAMIGIALIIADRLVKDKNSNGKKATVRGHSEFASKPPFDSLPSTESTPYDADDRL